MIRLKDGDDEAVLTLEEFERRARRGEISPFSLVSLRALTGDRFIEARELPFFGAMYDPRRIHFKRHFHVGRWPILTLALAALCIVMFLVARDKGDGAVTRDALLFLGAKARARLLEDGESWRIIVANVLHKDSIHLAFNLFALLNVGAVLEGVYRRGDWALLVTVAGVATMSTSAFFSGSITVGASGIVFGMLGAAVVFGWRFSDVLPSRHRNYFSIVVVVYVAIMFTLGFTNPSTDNWGHAGGLLAGVFMGRVLEPRLLRLRTSREPRLTVLVPWATCAVILAAVIAMGPMVESNGTRVKRHVVDAFGVVLVRPAHWEKVSDPLGFLTFGNGVDAFASLGCARHDAWQRLEDAERRFIDRELRTMSLAGNVGALEVRPSRAQTVGDGAVPIEARAVPFKFVASDGPIAAEAVIFVRGSYECALVLAHRPGASSRTLSLLDGVRRRLELTRTRAEVTMRAATSHGGTVRGFLNLALAHVAAGSVDDARTAYVRAMETAATTKGHEVEARFAAAQFEHDVGRDPRRGLAALGPLLSTSPSAEVLGLAHALHVAAGEHENAARVRNDLQRRFPDDERTRALVELSGDE